MSAASRAPLLLWIVALAALPGAAALLVPLAGASLDFTHGGQVDAHIADRALTAIPVIQNTSGAWPLLGAYLCLFGIACFAYTRILRDGALPARLVWAAFAAAALAMCALPFYPTTDPYAYALYALEAGPLHLNPYAVHDVAWAAPPWGAQLAAIFPDPRAYVRHCNYGPVAVFAYAALAFPFARFPLLTYLIAERLFGALCVALGAWALARSAVDSGERTRRLRLFALHPLVLTELVAFAHGDALMLALLAFGWLAWKRERFALSAACCVAALATRSVAVLALFALLFALARLRPRALPGALLGAIAAGIVLGGASLAAFGEISLGGPPAFNPFAAPLTFLAQVAGVPDALVGGVFAQAALGAVLVLLALRRFWRRPAGGALAWLPFGALAGLPAVYPHYLAWLMPALTLRSSDARFRACALTATFVAPVWYLARMNIVAPPRPSPLAYGVAMAIVWASVAWAALRARDDGGRTASHGLGGA